MAVGYFILTGNPTHIEGPLSWPEVVKRITPDKHGDTEIDGFFDAVPEQDSGYFETIHGKRINHDKERRALIIKGEIIVPKPSQVVTKFEEP